MKRLTMMLLGLMACGQAMADDAGQRVAAWAPSVTPGGPAFHAQTLRMVVHPSVGGTAPQVRVSNLYGTTPLQVGHATLGLQANGASPVPGSLRPLTVGGSASFTIPAGGEVWTDPAPVEVKTGKNLLVSLYLPDAVASSTFHQDAFETTYASADGAGDHAGDVDPAAFTETSTHWYELSAVTVAAPKHDTLVAFGDSITDGYDTPVSANARWPDALARRLVAGGIPLAVVDAGIGGNRVLTDVVPDVARGVSALKRFDHDVLSLPRVRTVILLEGINDIGNNAGPDGGPLTADHLIAGYRELIRRAHAAHIRILGGTILPYRGAGYFSEDGEKTRQAANDWIRTSGEFDGVIDFDKAVRDPAQPQRLKAAYDAGDHLHPNAAGMKAMADAIDLRKVR
ncbi:SGNH/GDSL hydrolase family protein [Luteibacter aegosomatis]|uniref:SGNH/GDSL hydrolase family protein n=1 Tax=Luteibacter aegosomatis TaxID=2911537 RepID=UPI001FF79675|nr:SGNH/GDSL hydrolase family protein [Luteibacter aegosomatis]UPG83969.1 SGNH/GDSL hydrolase family protein [Luteibacter aegosomatis]